MIAKFRQQLESSPLFSAGRRRYRELTARDQLIVKLLAYAVVALLIYSWVWKPINSRLNSAESRYQQQQSLLSWVKRNEPLARAAASSTRSTGSGTGNQSLLSVVGTSARQKGLELKRFEPENNGGLRVWLENVPFNQWIS